MKIKKNLTRSYGLFLIGAMFVLSCKESRNPEPNNSGNEQLDSSMYISSQMEAEGIARIQGKGIEAPQAFEITKLYYDEQEAIPNNSDYTKSIYFKADDLQDFLNAIVSANEDEPLCSAGELGVRVYFAKYPLQSTFPYPSLNRGKRTVVLRATCNGKDIAHQINAGTETLFVAYNFGDVCPPKCNPTTDMVYPNSVGKYNINGNCVGCPQ